MFFFFYMRAELENSKPVLFINCIVACIKTTDFK